MSLVLPPAHPVPRQGSPQEIRDDHPLTRQAGVAGPSLAVMRYNWQAVSLSSGAVAGPRDDRAGARPPRIRRPTDGYLSEPEEY